MAYTVKKISELSGVSKRALHFYEELGLLSPAYYGSNGYRYYGESELIRLQQILFYKELGLSLKEIKRIVGKNDFDVLTALFSHRKSLKDEWERIGILLDTIDKTINHLKGKKKMKDKEIFDGFNITLVKPDPKKPYFEAEKLVANSIKEPTKNAEEVKARGKEHYEKLQNRAEALFKKLALCISQEIDASAEPVQSIIQDHYELACETLNVTKKVYIAMAELYENHPEFRKQLEPFHATLPSFMANAMRLFADTLK